MIYDAERGDFRLMLLGDVMPTRRLSVFREERYLRLQEIVRSADAVFANLETAVHRYLEGHQNISGGTYMTTEPHLLEDLKWLGVNFVSTANNHAYDYGEEGIAATCRYLDAAGIVHAGSGRHLREARSPAYLDTARGRVALIAATATMPAHSIAGEQRPDASGRAGINPLRHSLTHIVDEQGFKELRRLGAALGYDTAGARRKNLGDAKSRAAAGDSKTYMLGAMRFEQGNGFALRTAINERDAEANLRAVKEARRMADWVVVSLHCHELGGEKILSAEHRSEIDEMAEFVVDFAHRAIDAGADVFAAHGPQEPFGVELYRNRPIFYSLGSTIFELETPQILAEEAYTRYGLDGSAGPADFADTRYQNDTVGHPADPNYWKQMIAQCEFNAKKLARIDLYPLDLGFRKPRWQRGRPILADENLGKEIIEKVASLSARRSTDIKWMDGHGVILV
jgi:poly-gamma-glutamate capsule biosynthesis protein CapA/YwtB (metallophosphatase superfamily)